MSALPSQSHRCRYDADRVESVLDCDALNHIALVLERAVSVIDDTSNLIEAIEQRNAAYEAQAMR